MTSTIARFTDASIPRSAGVSILPADITSSPRRKSSPRGRMKAPLLGGGEKLDQIAAAARPLDRDDRVRALRDRRAGHRANRLARANAAGRHLAGADSLDDRQLDGARLRRPGNIGGAHGVTVHRGVIEARDVARRADTPRRARGPSASRIGTRSTPSGATFSRTICRAWSALIMTDKRIRRFGSRMNRQSTKRQYDQPTPA